MVRDRMYAEDARRRSPSPRNIRRSQDFDLSKKNRNYSPDAFRVAVDYSPVGGKSRGVKRTERQSRDFDARGRRLYGDRDIGGGRDRDRYTVGGGRSRTPRRNQYRGDFDKHTRRENANLKCRGRERDSDRYPRSPLLIEQRDDIDRNVCLRSVRPLGSDESGKSRDVLGFDSGISRRSYEETHRRDELGDILDRYKTYDHVSARDYDCTGRSGGFGWNNLASEEDYLKNNRHLDSSHGGPLSGSQYYGSTLRSDYEMGGSIHSALHSDPADDIPVSELGSACGGIRMSSVTSPHHGSLTRGDEGQFHQEKREATYHDRDYYFEKKYAEFYRRDELLGIEKRMGKGIDNDGMEHNVQSSRDYFNDDNNYISSSSHPEDFPSASLRMMREDIPGYDSSGNIHISSHSIQTGKYLSSGPVGYANEKEQMIYPMEFGGELNDTPYGRRQIHRTSLRPVEEDYGQYYSPKTSGSGRLCDETSHKRYTRAGSRKMFPHPEARLTPEEVGAYGSGHARRRDLKISRHGNSYLNYDSETKQYPKYGSMQLVDHYTGGDGYPWPGDERYDMLQSREYTPPASRFCDSPHERLGSADLNLAEESERWMRYRHDKDEEMPCEYDDGGYHISTDGNGVRKIPRVSTDMVNCRPSSSQFVPRHSTSVRQSKKLHVSQRLKKSKPSAK